jgi:hypothetical protein
MCRYDNESSKMKMYDNENPKIYLPVLRIKINLIHRNPKK